MSWKKMILGEKMPDKDDPKYRERYEKEVDAGRKFAKATKIDRAAAKVQSFANAHKKAFLIMVFGFILFSFGLNLYRMGKVYNSQHEQKTATELQEEMIENRHKRMRGIVSSIHTMPPSVNKEFMDLTTKNNNDDGRTEEN
jgi:hypothetical protein